jgi:hypothetical protein
MTSHAANAGQHNYADRGVELYSTPPEAVRALCTVESLPHWCWDPAAGKGPIAQVLRDAGHAVICSDVVDHGFPLHFIGDFLAQTKAPSCECIITNPPYRLAQQFVEHALTLVPLTIMLLRLAFLESERRTSILDGGRLARVHVFKNRLPMMHRDQWAGPRATSSIPFAWFAWERGHTGPIVVDRISTGEARDDANAQ